MIQLCMILIVLSGILKVREGQEDSLTLSQNAAINELKLHIVDAITD